jgi:phage terminase large subunit GpA-like protein
MGDIMWWHGNCVICGSEGQKLKSIRTHHIDGNVNNNTKRNLISLCNSCHTRIHRNMKNCDNESLNILEQFLRWKNDSL